MQLLPKQRKGLAHVSSRVKNHNNLATESQATSWWNPPDCLILLKRFPWDQRKSESWCFLTLQVSEHLQERERINKLEQKHEDLCTDEKAYEEQMAKVVFLEEQLKHLRDEQELLW